MKTLHVRRRRVASAGAVNESHMLSTSIKRRASVYAVATAFSIANILAAVVDSAAEATSSFNQPGSAKISSAKIWRLLLLCGGAFAVSLLRARVPELQPLLETSVNRSATKLGSSRSIPIDPHLGIELQ